MFGFKPKQAEAPGQPAVEAAPMEAPAGFGAPNAAQCVRMLDEAIGRKRAKGAVLKLHLENFKLFNDTFGYEYGELLLEAVYGFLSGLGDAAAFRSGGIDFTVLLDRCGFSGAQDAAQVISDRFEEPWRLNDMDYMCTMTMGAVLYPDKAESGAEALRALDYAITETDQKACNAVTFYNSELEGKIRRKHTVAKLIRSSMEHLDEIIEVRYRPTFSRERGLFTRAECYPRIRSAELGIVGSAEFIPVAEDSGMICAVNNFVIRRACEQIRALTDAEAEFESIAVPVSPVQFLQKSFVEDMRKLMDEFELRPKKLAFEIVESMFINAFGRVNVVMQELSDMGVEFVLNEFGTGYSGINNILDLPVDVVKLERMFVWQLENNPRSRCLVEGLIQIARKLGLKIIAEGVETQNQIDLLAEYGCPYEQGFYYCATVNAHELASLLGKGIEAGREVSAANPYIK